MKQSPLIGPAMSVAMLTLLIVSCYGAPYLNHWLIAAAKAVITVIFATIAAVEIIAYIAARKAVK